MYHRFDKSSDYLIKIFELFLFDPQFLSQRKLVVFLLLQDLDMRQNIGFLINLINMRSLEIEIWREFSVPSVDTFQAHY